MICAGHPESGRHVFAGDSGGPLQCLNADGRWMLAGLTSFGGYGRNATKPGVYTDVASVFKWIKSNAEGMQ